MSAHQFFYQGVDDGVETEQCLFAAQLCVENNLEQNVAQFLCNMVKVPLLNRVSQLVALFQGRGHDAVEVLLQVPGTTVFRVAQPLHHPDKVGDRIL